MGKLTLDQFIAEFGEQELDPGQLAQHIVSFLDPFESDATRNLVVGARSVLQGAGMLGAMWTEAKAA